MPQNVITIRANILFSNAKKNRWRPQQYNEAAS